MSQRQDVYTDTTILKKKKWKVGYNKMQISAGQRHE